jgi:hypothetical protein
MNKHFLSLKTQAERFAYLKANKAELVAFKQSAIKYCDAQLPTAEEGQEQVIKALSTSTENDTESSIKRTLIGNTYNWMDSHDDVHVDNTFNKSIGERVGKIWHLHDHEQKITAKVGIPEKIYEQEVKWTDLGISKSGTTTALFMDSNILKDYNSLMFNEYKSGNVDQHSVGMYYVKVELALNDKDSVEEYKVWNQYINNLGNKKKAEEKGYFWAVKEAKLIEISAVLQGSNELTPTIEAKDNEPPKDTQEKKPLEDTSNKQGQGSQKVPSYY